MLIVLGAKQGGICAIGTMRWTQWTLQGQIAVLVRRMLNI